MRSLLISALLGGVLLTGLCTPEAMAEKKRVDIQKKWSGSVADEKLLKTAPEVIASAKKLEAIWKSWKIEGDVPTIDFAKYIVIVTHSSGSKLNLSSAILDEKGNLQVVGFGSRDIAPGFRFVMGAVSRDGVVSVNGKMIPKE